MAPTLAEHRYVVAFDARGCGESDWDPDRRYGIETLVADLEELRRELALERCELLGHSFGAVASCVYAARFPERVRKLVMVDAGPVERTVPVALAEPPPRSFSSRTEAAAALASSLPHGYPDWYLDARFETQPNGTLIWRGDLPGRLAWARAGGEPLIPGLWPYVEALRAPTLVLRGEESTLFPPENARRMVERNPRVTLIEVPGAGHLLHIEQPAAFLAAVLRFLGW